VWLDRSGNATPVIADQLGFQSPRLSPDGERLAVSIASGSMSDVWNFDLQRGSRLKLTTSGTNRRSVWSRDGSQIAFYSTSSASEPRADQDLYVIPSGGGEPTHLLTRPGPQYPDTWSKDGRILVFEDGQDGSGARRDLWMLPIGGKPEPLLVTQFNERGAIISPDGHSLAFVTDESGRSEVYVQPFPGHGPKVPISNNGGVQPMWARNGRELFYREADSLMAASIQPQPFRASAPRKLFDLPGAVYNFDQNFADYDVASDGRFIAVRRDGRPAGEIQVVLNWTEELRRALRR
jgi:Tol biopolymer transport system component